MRRPNQRHYASFAAGIALLVTGLQSVSAEVTYGFEFELSKEKLVGLQIRNGGAGTRFVKDPGSYFPERVFCTAERSPVDEKWPLLSFTYDMGGENGRTLEIATGPMGGGSADASLAKMGATITALYKHLLKGTLDPRKCSVVSGKPDLCFISLTSILAAFPGVLQADNCNSPDASYYGPGGEGATAWHALRANKTMPRSDVAGIVMSKTSRTPTAGRGGPQMTMGLTPEDLSAVTADSLFLLLKAGNETYERAGATHYVPGKAARVALWNNTKTFVAGIANPALDNVYRAYLTYVIYTIASHVRNHFDVDLWNAGDGYGDPSFKNAFGMYPKTRLTTVLSAMANRVDDVDLPSTDAVLTGTGVCGTLATLAPKKTKMGNSYEWVTNIYGEEIYPTISDMTCSQLFDYYWNNIEATWQHKPASLREDAPRLLLEVRRLETTPITIKMPATLDKVDADTSFTIAAPTLPSAPATR